MQFTTHSLVQGHVPGRARALLRWCMLFFVWGALLLGLGAQAQTPATPALPASLLGEGVQQIVAGESHTCALTTAGAVQCWGNNGNGQLGDGSTTGRTTPVAVPGLGSGVTALAAGGLHTCALTTAGAVQCWGYNDYGQLGDGSATHRNTPVAVQGLGSGVTALAAGAYHTCALTTAGAAQCWGNNGYGQLGDGSTTGRTCRWRCRAWAVESPRWPRAGITRAR